MKSRWGVRLGTLSMAAGVALFGLSATTANAQTVEYRGVAKLYRFSKACKDDGWKNTAKARTRYRPRNIGSNGDRTRIGFHFDYWATGFIKDGADIGRSFTSVEGQGFGTNYSDYGYQPKMRFTKHQPKTITSSTKRVKLAGDIKDFGYVKGCNVKFKVNTKLRK